MCLKKTHSARLKHIFLDIASATVIEFHTRRILLSFGNTIFITKLLSKKVKRKIAFDRGRFGQSYRGIREGILIYEYCQLQKVLSNIQRLTNSSDTCLKNSTIQQALPAELSPHFQKGQTPSAQSELRLLPWSHYERLIRVEDKKAREWYAKEAPLQKGQALSDLFQSHFPYNYPFIYKTITFSCIKFAISDIYAYLCRC